MKSESISLRKSVLSGAGHGAFVWTVYAVIESLFSALLPWLINPHYVNTTPYWSHTPAHWGFTAVLFVLYPAAGSVLGGLFSVLLRIPAKKTALFEKVPASTIFSAVAKLTLIVLFTVNLVVNFSVNSAALMIFVIVFVSLPLTVLSVSTISSRINSERFRVITSPWVICFALIGPLWISREVLHVHSWMLKTSGIIAYFAFIALLLFFIQKKRASKKPGGPGAETPACSAKSLAVLLCAAFVIVCLNFVLKQRPLLSPGNAGSSAGAAGSPNIVLIVMDTVRADHLSAYGYERDTTPHLKKLMSNATLYREAVAPSNMTLTTHASLFTGLYSRRHGAHFAFPHYPTGRPLQDKYRTTAEMLSEKGYFTSGIIGNIIYLTFYHGLDQGFQHLDARNRVPFLGQTQPYYLKQVIGGVFTDFFPLSAFELKWRRAEDLNSGAFDVLEKVKKDDLPFFLFINYMDAHWPYLPPAPFDGSFPGKDGRFTTERYKKLKDEVMNLKRGITDEESRHLVSQYDGAIAYIDLQIGNLIGRLKEQGLYENTLLIITSDHGEVFGERNIIEHSFTVYQDEVHVPLIIKYPNNNEGRVVDDVVSLVDIMPTISALVGDEPPEGLQGERLSDRENGNHGTVLSESFVGDHTKLYGERFQPEWAIFSGSSKFIRSAGGKREFYDLSKDPDEVNNLFRKDHQESEGLEKKLNEWLKSVKAESGPSVDRNREKIERLKTLGYVD